MRKMIVFMEVGYAGMDGASALLVVDDATEEEIQEEAYYMAVDHASSYGYYPMNEFEGDEYDEDEDGSTGDCYVDSIEGYAVDYDPELHDMHRGGGGSFEDDFARMAR